MVRAESKAASSVEVDARQCVANGATASVHVITGAGAAAGAAASAAEPLAPVTRVVVVAGTWPAELEQATPTASSGIK